MLAKASKGLRRLLLENVKIVLRNTFGNLETVTIDMGSDRIHLNEVRLLQLALAGTPTKVNAKIYSPEDLDILLAMKRKNANLSF